MAYLDISNDLNYVFNTVVLMLSAAQESKIVRRMPLSISSQGTKLPFFGVVSEGYTVEDIIHVQDPDSHRNLCIF